MQLSAGKDSSGLFNTVQWSSQLGRSAVQLTRLFKKLGQHYAGVPHSSAEVVGIGILS